MSAGSSSARRELVLAALLCASGAGLVLLAGGRTWVTVRAQGSITPFSQALSGGDLGAAAGALAWAGLAGLAALFATRGRVRAGVGGLLVFFGVGIAVTSVRAIGHGHAVSVAEDKATLLRLGSDPGVDTSLWWVVAVVGGLLLVCAGVLTVVRGAGWPGMSARYDRARPARAVASDDPAGLWKSLDRGEDPT